MPYLNHSMVLSALLAKLMKVQPVGGEVSRDRSIGRVFEECFTWKQKSDQQPFFIFVIAWLGRKASIAEHGA